MVQQPTGTVTFLFTDVEGSTRSWEEHPKAMGEASQRHDAILHDAVATHQGYVFKTVGDAFCTVFSTAPDALQASLAIQRALQAEEWGEVGAVRVRMALHTGQAEVDHLAPYLTATRLHAGDYAGPLLNRVARLLSAGHGGQILLTEATAVLVRDALPPGASLRDLGEHRLRDLLRPEHVYQVVAPDLPDHFPPLATLASRPNNLPLQATSFLGREREVDAICQQLRGAAVRLLTLVGPGGTGKSRLALQVAADLLDDFSDGVFFVPLEAIEDPRLVPASIAQVLGVREAGNRPIATALDAYLQTKQLLLVLDNFEQVVAAAPAVAALLKASPRLKVLVTSRFALQLSWEQGYPVPPLALPDPDAIRSADSLRRFPAVALFVARAQAIKPDFTLTDENVGAVVEICRRLDGLPLAIELAAARIRLLPPRTLLGRLQGNDGSGPLRLLTTGAKDLSPRQSTLRATIEWSIRLLDPAEQALFRRLGVFVGGFDLPSVEAQMAAEDSLPVDALDGLASLLSKSLVAATGTHGGEPRFAMLQTIREYAVERLEAGGEHDETHDRHAAYFLVLAEQADPELLGPRQLEWLDRLEGDLDNLRAAIRWSVAKRRADEAVRLAGSLRVFWELHSHVAEGRAFLRDALALPGGAEPSAARGRALFGAARLAMLQQDLNAAAALFEESLQIREKLGDKRGVASSLNGLGWVTFQRGDDETAGAKFGESLALRRQLGIARDTATSLVNLAEVALRRQDFAAAASNLDEALLLFRQVGDPHGESMVLSYLGDVALARNDLSAARSSFERRFALARAMGHGEGIALALEGLAAIAALEGRADDAVTMAGAAAAVREASDVPLSSSEEKQLEQRLEPARRALDARSQTLAWEHGKAMSPEEASILSKASV